MATFDATTSANAIDFNTLNLADILSGTFVITTPTLLRVDLGGGVIVDLTGTGLAYAGVTLTAGTFESIEYMDSGSRVYLFSDISVAATDYAAFNLANDNTGLLTSLLTGDDSILGSGFDDVLIGGAGADAFTGGAGTDTVSYGLAAAGVRVKLIENRGIAGEAIGDTFSGIENLTGSAFDDLILGDQFSNVIRGGAGDDNLNGSLGDDTLYGDGGRDNLVGGAGADLLFGGAGSDTASYENAVLGVDARLIHGLGFKGDAAGDQYIGIENLYGSRSDDTLYGDDAANVLFGNRGNDILMGLGGDDTLKGGLGNDIMYGGDGDDTLIAGISGRNSMFGGAGSDTFLVFGAGDAIDGGTGTDTVSYRDTTLGVSVSLIFDGGPLIADVLTNIENLTGGKGNDILEGDASANVLRGLAGDDILTGGAGADVLDGGEGSDTADYTGAGAMVDARLVAGLGFAGDANGDSYVGIENLLGSGFDDILVGSPRDNLIAGGAGDDNLNGLGGDDTLIGGAGNDRLFGRGGADLLTGGAGNDLFVFEPGHGADRIVDFEAGAGIVDTIFFDNGAAAPNNFADVQAAATQVGADIVIDLGGGDTITLLGVNVGDLAADDFMF